MTQKIEKAKGQLPTSSFKKYKIILEEFTKRQNNTLDAYDDILQEKLQKGTKQIQRILDELANEFDNIIVEKQNKKKVYHLIKPIDLFVEAFDKSEEIGWLFHLAHEGNPEIFKDLEQFTNQNKHIYKFKNTPFEDIQTLEQKNIFKKLKKAVQNREYVKITTLFDNETLDNLKALKLLFIDNNWYFVYVDPQNNLKLARISFIKSVDYATKINFFQPSSVQKHLEFLEKNLQNSLTLYGVKPQKATLKATPNIARYFQKDMKKFLSTQQFQKQLDDGSIIFTVKYTQPLEILPFIQKWLPDIIILKPKELIDEYITKLEKALQYQQKER